LAVDCDEPNVKLSEPPYPFKQRWDPSQQRYSNWWANGGKQRKKKARKSYGQDWNGDEELEDVSYLEYDEPAYEEEEEQEGEEDYADGETEMAEFAEAQLVSEAAELIDDLPSLPADVETLPELKERDLVPGAVIVFKWLECSQATNWTPVMSAHRTAKVLQVLEEGLLEVELAIRDRDVRDIKYDKDGKRVYEKFEMNAGDGDGDGVDHGFREIWFADMVKPKLLRAPEADGETVKV
jgi:hypothetical protein